MEKIGLDIHQGPPLIDIISIQSERTKTLKEMAERSRYFYEEVILSDQMKAEISDDLKPILLEVKDCFTALHPWTKETIHDTILKIAEKNELKLGKLAQPLRIIMTGGTISPPIDATIYLIGRERAIMRLNHMLNLIFNLYIDKP